MCGIVGFRSTTKFHQLKEFLPVATAQIHHRGPDDSGLFFDEKAGAGLGHRRLSVIDLSAAGRQPMQSEDGQVCITYNGEIYNFKAIRKTLEACGHRFKSATDTEVLLKAYLQWDIDCIQKFVGMFAFAIWDGHKRRFFLAIDRLGIKPLYFHFSEAGFIFASELKAIMAVPGFNKDIDPDSIPLFLHYQYIPAPKTIFKNTYKLLPGHFLIFNHGETKSCAYWQHFDVQALNKNSILSEQKTVQQLDSLLTTAVADRLVSDVPLGALLSGGIDSSLVVALMQKINSSPVKTFSIGFKEKGYDEAPWARKIATYLQTDHTELYVSPGDALRVIPKLPDIYDEPFADSSAIPTFLISQLTRKHVTVALSGDGGDEQFSGYVRYWSTKALSAVFKFLPQPVKKNLAAFFSAIPPQLLEKIYRQLYPFLPYRFQVANFSDKWQKSIQLLTQTSLSDIYRMTICLWSQEELFRLMGKAVVESTYEETFRHADGWPLLSQLMQVDQKTYLPNAMLTKVDRASMANGLEIRVPFLDHRIVEYSTRLSDTLKYRNGTGKYILKKILARYLPNELFERPKMGFGVPIDHWLRHELKDLLTDYLAPDRLKKENLFDPDFVQKKITAHLTGRENHQYRLWAILMWEMWRERWI